jgi:voltage-gated potassium channel
VNESSVRHARWMIDRLREIRRNEGYATWARWTDWPLIVLAFVFLVVLIVPLAQPLSSGVAAAFAAANVVIWIIFTADYLIRLWLAPDRREYVRTHIIDLMVVAVPFLRGLRLLRVVAIVVAAARRAGGLAVRQVTLYAVGIATVVISVSAVVVLDAERAAPDATIETLGDALWWAVTTVTTVGYGDLYPTTATGRVTAGLLMVTGIALVGVVTAAVAAWFVGLVQGGSATDEENTAQDEQTAVPVAELIARIERLQGSVDALHRELRS